MLSDANMQTCDLHEQQILIWSGFCLIHSHTVVSDSQACARRIITFSVSTAHAELLTAKCVALAPISRPCPHPKCILHRLYGRGYMAARTMCSTSASCRLFNEQGKNKLVNLIKFIDGNCLELCRGGGRGSCGAAAKTAFFQPDEPVHKDRGHIPPVLIEQTN